MLDVPPAAREWLRDPARSLFITEGSKKADAAVTAGLCCIALMGVWGWRGSNEQGGTTALADWEYITLKGRVVYITFDSDVMTKREVYTALVRLKAFLDQRGARVQIIYLAPGEGGAKMGLDDFLAEHTTDDLLALARPELLPPTDSDVEAATAEAQAAHELARPLLDDLVAFIKRYVVLSDAQANAVALWIMHSHAMDAADATPYLSITPGIAYAVAAT